MAGSLRINLNGCPNACAQYQVADIGLQGGIARLPDGPPRPGLHPAHRRPAGRGRGVRPAGRLEGDPGRRRPLRGRADRARLRGERAPGMTFGEWADGQPRRPADLADRNRGQPRGRGARSLGDGAACGLTATAVIPYHVARKCGVRRGDPPAVASREAEGPALRSLGNLPASRRERCQTRRSPGSG